MITVWKVLNILIDFGWAKNMSLRVVFSLFALVKYTYLCSSNFEIKYCMSPLILLHHLVRIFYTCMIVIKLSLFFCFKSMRIFLDNAKLFVMSITLFFSSSFILPARRWSANFGTNSWLWIALSIANHQSFVSLSNKSRNLNRQSHFLELMPSRFDFFLAFGGLYSPLLSHCIVKNVLFKLNLSIYIYIYI